MRRQERLVFREGIMGNTKSLRWFSRKPIVLAAVMTGAGVLGPTSTRLETSIPARANVPVPVLVKVEKPLTVEDQIREAVGEECREYNLGRFCVHDLLGIAWAESQFDYNRIGDNGKSYGCFRIHRGYHDEISVEQVRDIHFAAAWTLNRLVKNGYPKSRSYAIMAHNGSPDTERTREYLDMINRYRQIHD